MTEPQMPPGVDPDPTQPAAVAEVLRWIADEYRRCIVSARCTRDGYKYERANGRAEAYRRATDRDSTRVRQHPDRGWRTEQNAQAAYRGESGAHRGEPVPPQDPDGDTDREPR